MGFLHLIDLILKTSHRNLAHIPTRLFIPIRRGASGQITTRTVIQQLQNLTLHFTSHNYQKFLTFVAMEAGAEL